MKNNKICVHQVGKRLLCGLLSLVMTFSLLPVLSTPAAAASWMEPYLQKLVSWDIMRGDSSGNLNPDRPLSRAEFVVLVNRAFGYQQTSAAVPFKDVKPSDWYYDDINIGFTIGYFNGTSKNAASPKATVTREQAAVLLGRNLMLDNNPGANLDFNDSNRMGTWSRGIIHSAVSEGIISGYKDGSFKPKANITRGQMAVLLVNAIGTPVNKPGGQTLGGVYGNVTVSTSGVTLRNTTIAGNLYITGGLGLGDIVLENVTVLGKIVICGAGESSKGDNSVVMRNVTAPTLIMDNLANNMVSIRAEGDTKIDNTFIRTPSYVEDATDDTHGFASIRLDGEPETSLSVAGNLKDIITVTPKSAITVAKGSVKELTVDETATGSTVAILSGAVVRTLNLDVGTKVTGTGDIEHLVVNAPGSTVSMLPDIITIRPGITADIDGSKMDTVLAAESSADPRLLAGYPKITDLGPTSAKSLLRTNKEGTIYWAITSITDGSVGDADLLNPSNKATILKSGNLKAAKSNTDYTAALSSLTADGSYYISAMLVDAREQHSPVKAISFSTPDNTIPAFAAGFPFLSKITSSSAQATVMPTKTCRMYYALLPKSAAAPTPKDFKANAVSGNLGFGSIDVTKNITSVLTVNRAALEELGSYDLYFWLTDVDGAHSSAVTKLAFTTVDGTPPVFLSLPTVNSIKETSVGMSATLNEIGDIFWVAVKEGDEYPKPMGGQASKPSLDSEAAKLQVANGMNALKSGKVAATANKDVTISVTGLTSEAAYDIYYVAQDKAGNYSAVVGKLTIHTLDTNPPSISQKFSSTNDLEGKAPLADTDVSIIFSENVQDKDTNQQLLAVYQESQKSNDTTALANLLRGNIQLYCADTTPAKAVAERSADGITDWVIDYRKAVVTADDGKIVVTFKNKGGINLQSGSKYYFEIKNIADTSNNKNIIKPNPQKLDPFTTVFAQVDLAYTAASGTTDGTNTVTFDMSFKAVPISTANVSDTVLYDILFRTTSSVAFQLYTREGLAGNWTLVKDAKGNAATATLNPSADGTVRGASYSRWFRDKSTNTLVDFEALKGLSGTREYGVVFTALGGNTDRTSWNGKVELEVRVIAGSNFADLNNLAKSDVENGNLTDALSRGSTEIGNPTPYPMRCLFSDSVAPVFQFDFPAFVPSDTTAIMNLQLSRSSGKIYYVVAPVETIRTVLDDVDKTLITKTNWDKLPMTTTEGMPIVSTGSPTSSQIMNPGSYASNPLIKTGVLPYSGSTIPAPLTDLEPETQYCAYFVLQGDSQNVYTPQPYIFCFKTTPVSRPIIQLDINNPSVNVTVDSSSTVDYLLAVNGQEPGRLRELMSSHVSAANKTLFDGTTPVTNGGYGATYTVLDAMSADYRDATNTLMGSVFDQYAITTAKDTFANYIRAQVPSGGSTTMKNTITVAAGKTATVDCSKGMTGNTWYTFLAVGKSTSGSGDAFRATRPVFNTDDTAPMITNCSFVGSVSPSGICGGSLTILFSEDLYWVVKADTDQTVTPIVHGNIPDTTGKTYPAGLAFEPGLGSGIKYTSGSQTGVISSVSFTFAGAKSGSTIAATAQIGDKGGNVHTVPLSVTLSYDRTEVDGKPVLTPKFAITKAWDATGK